MTLDQIKALPVQALASKNAALFLWVLDTHLPQALEAIEAWGFTFKTIAFVWVKTSRDGTKFPMSCGWWTRAGSELCLLATRGKPSPQAHDVRRVIFAPRREHSRKPDEVYTAIERLCLGPFIELFARSRRPGWDVAFSDQPDRFSEPPRIVEGLEKE